MYTSKTCGPCKGIKPHIEKINTCDVAFVDIDEFDFTDSYYGHYFQKVPTFIVFKHIYVASLPIAGALLEPVLKAINI